ncbi:MAG: serine/threonine-protein kinase, partial [Isosphaeraceae bacterium]
MGESSTAENTLFEVLALRLGLVDEQSLRDSLRGGLPGPGSLGEWLVRLGHLSDVDRARVDALASAAIEKHGGDAAAACAELEQSVVVPGIAIDSVAGQEASLDTLAPPSLQGDSVSASSHSHARHGGPRYVFSRLHAQGGLGQVWVAVDQDLKREVALKEIRAEVAENQEVRRRFLREAEITGQLEHPNIVPVHELGRRPEDGRPFYTMRFVRGRTLRDAIADDHRRRASGESDPLARLKLLQAFATVCQAIAFAHDRGVVHRDLKPGNVVLGPFGEVVVLDWGLAKRVATDHDGHDPAAPPDDPAAPADATLAGSLLGTPAYMAPEQAEGRVDAIDARTDVYGLGAVLFEILTGRPPYSGTKTEETIRAITKGPTPRARTVDPKVPRALDAVCARAMEREPSDRYASALDLAREIDRYLADEPVTACREPVWDRARRWVARHRLGVTVAAAVFLTLGPALAAGLRYADLLNLRLQQERHFTELAQVGRDAARLRRDEAQRREKEQAQAARYSQLLTQLRSRDEARVGWSAAAVATLNDLARVETPIRDPLDLRNEAAAVFTGLDLTDARDVAKGVVGHSVAFGPGDATVAVSQLKTNVLGKCSVFLAGLGPDGNARTRTLDLALLQMRKPGATGLFGQVVQDGLRGIAFSPDGRWLVVGTRGGSIVRWDLSAATPVPTKWPAHQGDDPRIKAWERESKATRLKVEPLDDAAVDAVISSRGVNAASLDSKQHRILRSPQGLYLWLALHEGDNCPPTFRTTTDLMRRYWVTIRRRLTTLKPGQYESVIEALVAQMDRRGTLSAPRTVVDGWPDEVDALLSLNVLVEGPAGKLLFNHQSSLDYLSAVRILNQVHAREGTVLGWLAGDDQSLFRRGQLRQILTMLRDDDPGLYIDSLRGLLQEQGVRFHLRHLAIQMLGHSDIPTLEEAELIVDLLESPDWVDHVYFQVLAGREAWFDELFRRGVLRRWLDGPEEWKINLAIRIVERVVETRGEAIEALFLDRGQVKWPERLVHAIWRTPPEKLTSTLFDFTLDMKRRGEWRVHDFADWKSLAQASPRRCLQLLETKISRDLDELKTSSDGGAVSRRNRDYDLMLVGLSSLASSASTIPIEAWDTLVPRYLQASRLWRGLRRRSRRNGWNPHAYEADRSLRQVGRVLRKVLTAVGREMVRNSPEDFWHRTGSKAETAKPLRRLIDCCIAHGSDGRADAAIRRLLSDPSRLRSGHGDRGSAYRPAWKLIRRYSAVCS